MSATVMMTTWAALTRSGQEPLADLLTKWRNALRTASQDWMRPELHRSEARYLSKQINREVERIK